MKNLIGLGVIIFALVSCFFSCSTEDVVVADMHEKNTLKKSNNFPGIISLPDGFNPEGIVAGYGNKLYVGSLIDGRIVEIDARTGESSVLVSAQENRIAVGLAFDERTGYLFVAGGTNGNAYIYDSNTGMEVATIQLTAATFPEAFINDVTVTDDAAYFTNSFMAEFYKVPLNDDGTLNLSESVETISLIGDFMITEGFNANGIVANGDGSKLIIVHSALGKLYLTDSNTGDTTEIDLQGETVVNGDGLVLKGNKLYVVQNNNNQVSVIRLDGDQTSGEIVEIITNDNFRIPTTAAIRGNRLYIVNARFDVAPPPFLGLGYDPTIEFNIVRIRTK